MKTNWPKPAIPHLTLAAAFIVSGACLQPLHQLQAQPAHNLNRKQVTPADFGARAGQIADEVTGTLKGLNLTDTQKAALKSVAARYAPQVRAVVTNPNLTQSQKSEQLAALRNAARAEAAAVLTPVQQAKVKALRTRVEAEIKDLVSQISAEVNLSGEQKAAIKALLQDARTQASAIVSDEALSRFEKRSELQELASQTRKAVRALLDDSQLAQWDAIAGQIRSAVQSRVLAWRKSGGLGFGLTA